VSSEESFYGLWKPLSRSERVGWLANAYTRHFGQKPFPGSIELKAEVHLDGSDVDDVEGFFCAIGEAVNGPGGYFGQTINGFADAAVGGFGTTKPWKLVIRNHERAKLALGYAESHRYSSEYYRIASFADADAKQTAQRELLDLANGRGKTLFAQIVEILEERGVVVVLR